MVKIYVACDLEGTAGVIDHRQQCQWDVTREWYAPFLHQARRLATLELNALVEGALAGGATDVLAWDGHGKFPGGLDVELLHPECRLVMGAGDGGPEGLDGRFQALFQLGLHARAGTPRAILAHSFWGQIVSYSVNGAPVGEIWMNCYTAGLAGVPCVFLSGDRAAADEARQIVPGIEVAAVKEGLSPAAVDLSAVVPGISLAPEKARQVIRAAAQRAVGKIGSIAPFKPEPPFALRVQFTEARLAESRAGRPGAVRVDDTTVEMPGAEQPWLLL